MKKNVVIKSRGIQKLTLHKETVYGASTSCTAVDPDGTNSCNHSADGTCSACRPPVY